MPREWDATRRQFLTAAVSSTLFTARSDAKPAPSPDGVLAEFPVYSDGDFLIIPLTIGEKEYPVIVDTGAQCTALDDSLAFLLGAELDVKVTINGEATATAHPWPKAHLAELDLSMTANALIVRMNLQRLREGTGRDVFGILDHWMKLRRSDIA